NVRRGAKPRGERSPAGAGTTIPPMKPPHLYSQQRKIAPSLAYSVQVYRCPELGLSRHMLAEPNVRFLTHSGHSPKLRGSSYPADQFAGGYFWTPEITKLGGVSTIARRSALSPHWRSSDLLSAVLSICAICRVATGPKELDFH